MGATFDATGSTLNQWVMISDGAKERLVVRSRQVAASPPRQIVTGNFDTDQVPDLLWSFGTRTDADIQLAYARTAEGAPLTAFAPISSSASVSVQPDRHLRDRHQRRRLRRASISVVEADTATGGDPRRAPDRHSLHTGVRAACGTPTPGCP